MSFIGIVCTTKQEGYIKQILHSNLEKENVIILKEDNIENFKNITFEIVAIFSNRANIFEKKETIEKIVEKAKYFVVNADESISPEFIKKRRGNVITYGFSTKSTVTTSSVKEDNILICLQRTIQNRFEKNIEPQEILIPLSIKKANATTIMGIVSILLVYGKELLPIGENKKNGKNKLFM